MAHSQNGINAATKYLKLKYSGFVKQPETFKIDPNSARYEIIYKDGTRLQDYQVKPPFFDCMSTNFTEYLRLLRLP